MATKSAKFSHRFIVMLCVLSLLSPYGLSAPALREAKAPAGVRAVWVRPFINADEATRGSAMTGRGFIRAELERIKRVGHFYDAGKQTLDERYLALRRKYDFDGIGLFAAQLLTDDLITKLARGAFAAAPGTSSK